MTVRPAKLPRIFLLAASCILGGLACDGTPEGQVPVHPAKGTVTYQGKPIRDALVVLQPTTPAQPPTPGQPDNSPPQPTGRTGADGTFQLHTYLGNDGAPVGEYRVSITISPQRSERNLMEKTAEKPTTLVLPAIYADPAKSGLTATIKPGENTLPPFELK